MERSRKKDLITTLAVLLVVVFVVTGVIITKKRPAADSAVLAATTTNTTAAEAASTAAAETAAAEAPTTTTTAVDTPAAAPATAPTTPTNTSGFTDGTYSATGSYSTPEDVESITVNVTLKDGVVTDTSATSNPHSRDSKEYISAFIQNYKPQVVGKSIASLKLSRVSGSSLTSQGFNSAIAQIQTQAKA